MYINYHLAITKKEFSDIEYPIAAGMNIVPVKPEFESFMKLFKKVGSPWDWDRRPKYTKALPALKERLLDNGSSLFLLKSFNETAGYCLAVRRNDLTAQFNKQAVAEIENFGLFPEHTSKGYGRSFLPLVFNHLFENSDVVYLSSRSTNHPRVIPFYESLSMTVIRTEQLHDDLVPKKPDAGLNLS